MKIEINKYGVLTISPENAIEVYALKKYADEAWVTQEDTRRSESGHWRGSTLIIELEVPT